MFYTTVERHDEALTPSPGPQPPCTVGIGVTKNLRSTTWPTSYYLTMYKTTSQSQFLKFMAT